MTEDTKKCVEVLTRCGPYSRNAAVELVRTLTKPEVELLKQLHAGLARLEEPPGTPAGIPVEKITDSDRAKRQAAHEALLAEIGDKFNAFRNALADRLAEEAEKAKAKAGPAHRTANPVIVGTGEP